MLNCFDIRPIIHYVTVSRALTSTLSINVGINNSHLTKYTEYDTGNIKNYAGIVADRVKGDCQI